MTDLFISLLTLFTVWLLGALSLNALGCRERGASFLKTVPVDFCIGSGLLYILLFMTSIATGRFRPEIIYIAITVLAAISIYSRRGIKKALFRFPNSNEIIGMTLIVVLSSLIILPSRHIGLDGDGWAIWAFKATAFFEDGRVDFSFLSDMERYAYSHPDYPLLIPTLEYWVYLHLSHINDHVIRSVPISFWILMLSFFYSTLSERLKRHHAALGTALLAITWPLTEGAILGMVDGVQALYNLAGLVYMFRWIEKSDDNDLWTAAIILGFGANVKNEGFGFWTAASASLFLSSVYEIYAKRSFERFYSLFVFAIIGAAMCLPWIIEKKVHGIGSELFLNGIPCLSIILERLGKLALHYLSQVIAIGYAGWGLLWIFTLLAFLKMWGSSCLREERYLVFLGTCLAQFLILLAVYSINSYDLDYHIQTSGVRTLLQIVPAVFWIGMMAAFSTSPSPSSPSPSPG